MAADDIPPQAFRWDGEAMIPLRPWEADKHYCIGETYWLAEIQERSDRSHNHYFACINTAWGNLPEHYAKRFPTPEHLRKYALIQAGFADSRQLVCPSRDAAVKMAGFVRPIDEYAIVTVSGCVVTIWTAKSQKMRRTNNGKGMAKDEFHLSKQKVLEIVADMIGISADDLAANTSV